MAKNKDTFLLCYIIFFKAMIMHPSLPCPHPKVVPFVWVKLHCKLHNINGKKAMYIQSNWIEVNLNIARVFSVKLAEKRWEYYLNYYRYYQFENLSLPRVWLFKLGHAVGRVHYENVDHSSKLYL